MTTLKGRIGRGGTVTVILPPNTCRSKVVIRSSYWGKVEMWCEKPLDHMSEHLATRDDEWDVRWSQ